MKVNILIMSSLVIIQCTQHCVDWNVNHTFVSNFPTSDMRYEVLMCVLKSDWKKSKMSS